MRVDTDLKCVCTQTALEYCFEIVLEMKKHTHTGLPRWIAHGVHERRRHFLHVGGAPG